MVGVPHSKACVTCRARRKGCDAARPFCGQCLQRGVACGGYVKALNIVWERPGSKISLSTNSVINTAPQKKAKAFYGVSTLPLTPLSPSFRDTAARIQMLGYFFDNYLPHPSSRWADLNSNLDVLPKTSWLITAASFAVTSPSLNDAMTALAMAHFVPAANQEDILRTSLSLYARAVTRVNRSLREEAASMDATTLATVMTLSIYEMQAGVAVRSKSWLLHVNGATTLVKLRGARNFSDELSHKLFLGTRLPELINAVGNRQHINNTALWSSLRPTLFLGKGRDCSHSRLFEILEFLPEILDFGDAITTEPGQNADSLVKNMRTFSQMCEAFQQCLMDWFSALPESDRPEPIRQDRLLNSSHLFAAEEDWRHTSSSFYWFEPSTIWGLQQARASKRAPQVFQRFICFRDPDIAEQIVLYWTGLLLMRMNLHAVRERCCQDAAANLGIEHAAAAALMETESSSSSSSSSPTTSPYDLALAIAQSLEYFLHPDMGLLGTNFIGFPLAVSQAYFENCRTAPPAPAAGGEEVLWFDVIFNRMRDMKSGLADFLEDMYKGETLRLRRR